MGGMTSASSASVAPSSPALAALVWSIPSLHRPGYSCHAISKSRSPASSARPVVRRAAHKWAPGTPPFASLRPSATSALSRYVASLSKAQAPARHPLHATVPAASLTLAPLPASQRLSSYLARRFPSGQRLRPFIRWDSRDQLQILAIRHLPRPGIHLRVLRRLSLWSLDAPSDTLLQTLCNATTPVSCADYPYGR